MGDKVQGVFVAEKVNKVRWKPEGLVSSNYFLVGGWDNETCHLALWCDLPDEDDTCSIPKKLKVIPHHGDVTELQFINSNTFVASSSLGSAKCMEVDVKYPDSPEIKEVMSWENIHFLQYGSCCSCTSLACFEEDVVTIGEDGRINLLNVRQRKPVHIIDEADSSTMLCVCFLKHNEILTGNLRGHMKIWDLKSSTEKPTLSFMMSNDQIAATCVTHHPTQRHLVLAGGEDGGLTIWDLRHNIFPITVLSAHTSSVAELQFHPDHPEHLFSCSADGGIWQWKTEANIKMSRLTNTSDLSSEESPWLSGNAAKNRMQIYTLMQLHKPINSLDVNKTRLVFGCDNEAVYICKDIDLYQ